MKIRGIEIELHPNEDLSNHIRREQDFFEAEILDYLVDYHKNQETILDVGANIGNHSIFFANFLNYDQIICFEPILANYKLLKQNMASYNNIGLIQMAASEATNLDLRMFENYGNMGASYVHPNGDISVTAVSIDKMNFQNVSLIKIDVEGHEPAVLDGAQDTIYRNHPLILIEDWERKYDKLLTGYILEKGWPEHQTFLYRWNNVQKN